MLRARTWVLVVLAFVAVLVATGICLWLLMLKPEPYRQVPLDGPNGYDDLFVAADLLDSNTEIDLDGSTDALGEIVFAEREALERAQLGLTREVQVPLLLESQIDINQANQAAVDRVGLMRQVGRLLVADAIVAAEDDRYPEAILKFRRVLQFSRAITSDGLLLDLLTGFAFEWIALERIAELAPELEPDLARNMIVTLVEFDQTYEPIDRVRLRERAYYNVLLGWRRIPLDLSGARQAANDPAFTSAQESRLRNRTLLAMVMASLALEAQKKVLENDAYLESLEDLVPSYLPEVPRDAFHGQPIRYERPEPDRFFLRPTHDESTLLIESGVGVVRVDDSP